MVSNVFITKLKKRLIEKLSLIIFIFLLISYGIADNKLVIQLLLKLIFEQIVGDGLRILDRDA